MKPFFRSGRAAPREFTRRSAGVLLAAVVALSFGPFTLLSTFSLFVQPIGAEFGWNRAEVAIIVTLFGLGSAAVSPFIGSAVDSRGPRRVLFLSSFLLGLILLTLPAAGRSRWSLYAAFTALGLINAGMVPYGRLLVGWFDRRRGLAHGLHFLGNKALEPLILLAMRPLIDGVGWRGAYACFGAVVLLFAVPVIHLWFREPSAAVAVADVAPAAPPGRTAAEAWRSREFWLIAGNIVLSMFIWFGLLTHGVPMLTEHGLSRTEATTALSALSIGNLIAQPLIGYLLDRIGSPLVILPFVAAGFIGLMAFDWLHGPAELFAATLILGLGISGEGSAIQYWISRYFGLRHFSLIYGSIQPMTLLLSISGGPLLIGALHDGTGSYGAVFLLMMAVQVSLFGLVFLFRPYVFLPGTGEAA